MLEAAHRRRRNGFTIVELLIVIVVIAILAAITIVAYNGIQGRANDSAVQYDLNAIAKKLELYKIDNGKYPSNHAGLISMGVKVAGESYALGTYRNLVYCYDSTNDQYTLSATSKTEAHYYIASVNGGNIKPYPGTWTNATGVQPVCDGAAAGYTYVIYGHYNSTWQVWTGYS